MSYEPTIQTTQKKPILPEEELAGLFKALGHPARIKILEHLLAENKCVCGRIVEILPLAQSTVSQHLKIMKDAGLVQGEVEGPKTCYCVNREKLQSIYEVLGSYCTKVAHFNKDKQ